MTTAKSSRVLRATSAGAICLALAFGTAGAAFAGSRPHDHGHGDSGHSSFGSRDNGQVNAASGVITALGANSITLKGRHGTSTTYTTTSATTYFEGKSAGVVGDLAVGERVNLELTSTSPQTVTKVTICLVRYSGTVTGVSGNAITISAFHDTSLTVEVSGTTTYTSDGAASSLAAVLNGVVISAVGIPGSSANTLDANAVNIFTPPVQTHASGVITALGANSITLKGRHGTSTTYTTTSATTYFEGKSAGVVGDLAVGERVNLELTSTSPQTVTKVTICLVRYSGTVTGVSGNAITISAFHDTSLTVEVSGTTTYTSDGAASSLAAVLNGVVISAVGIPGSSANTLDANAVNIFTPPVQTHASGVITALGANSITLKGRHGTSTTYTTTSATTYFEGKSAGVVGDLAVGERVNLELTSTSPQTVTKVTICLVRYSGTVTGVSGNAITISAFHDTSLTVEVSGTTTYTSDGAASSLAAVLNGVVISAVGIPGSSANTLDANAVNIFTGIGHGPGKHDGGPTWGARQHGRPGGHKRH